MHYSLHVVANRQDWHYASYRVWSGLVRLLIIEKRITEAYYGKQAHTGPAYKTSALW